MCPGDVSGKKQDIWYVIDLLTGEKQQTLSSAFADSLCPSTSLLYLGRTGKKEPFVVYKPACFQKGREVASARVSVSGLHSRDGGQSWFLQHRFYPAVPLPKTRRGSPRPGLPSALHAAHEAPGRQQLPLPPPPSLRPPHVGSPAQMTCLQPTRSATSTTWDRGPLCQACRVSPVWPVSSLHIVARKAPSL